MIKNRTVQVVYQTVYCVLALIGFIASLGYFNAKFNVNFYIYYTNLSNYICMVFILISLIITINKSYHKEDGYISLAPKFKFMCVIMIMVTFLVYNILLAKENTIHDYFFSISNLIMHVILPLMFIVEWLLFYEHGKVRWYYPLLCLIMPLIYVGYILIRAAIITPHSDTILYPYFFLNVEKLGWGGFILWLSALIGVFIIIGYLLLLFDNLKKIRKK